MSHVMRVVSTRRSFDAWFDAFVTHSVVCPRAGKPSLEFADQVRQSLGCPYGKMVMVGDRNLAEWR